MKELTHKTGAKTEELTERTVTIFLQSNFIVLKGNWFWDLNTNAAFCSEVMFSWPADFTGAKGIIHPDDRENLVKKLQPGNSVHLEFRMISTYGEVKNLVGENVTVEEAATDFELLCPVAEAIGELERKKDYERLQLLQETYGKTEKYTNTGVWWYNQSTSETWYSAHMFRIHDLAPQSLNAHLNTFVHFIHPEDRDEVTEAFHKAYKQKIPLHIEYRIKTPFAEKYVLQTTQWFFNNKGESILSGTLHDISGERSLEDKVDDAGNLSAFHKQQLVFGEQLATLGHWQVNLVTRKTAYSNNFYRIFGLKPQAVPAGVQGIINFIHPHDRDAFAAAQKKMLYEHSVPELDFRITRTDGKLRYISQKAKLLAFGNEMVMAGIIMDVTVQKMLEKKLKEVQELAAVKNFAQGQAEEMAGMAGWVWDITSGTVVFSENFYRLLGYKPNAIELSQNQLLQFIHPGDKKRFKDELAIVLGQKQETTFTFRLLSKGNTRHVKASFRIMNAGDGDLFISTLQDVTLEHMLQAQLNQRVQLAEALSENILDRVVITDLSNNILLWNRQCEEVYRVKKGEVLGKNFFDVFPQLKTDESINRFNRALKGESIVLKEHKSLLGHGYYNMHMQPFWSGEREEVAGIIHIIRDVTEEVELRQNLNDRLNFIENLVDSSVDRIIAMDSNLNYLVWNKKCEECYGLKKEEVIGRNVLELFPATQNTPAFNEFKKVLKGETVHIPPDKDAGKENFHEIYLIPVKNKKNETSAILWILHDLSKEYDLMKEQRRSGEIINALKENYFEVDTAYRIIYVNPKAEEFFRKKMEDLIGKNVWEIFPEALDTPVYHAMTKAMTEKVAVRGEFISPTKGTSIFSSMMPVENGVAVIFFDIHELKQAEEKLQKSKDLLQAVFNASLNGIVVFKTIRDDEGAIVDFEFVLTNEVSRKWNGRELSGKRYAEEFPGIKENGIFDGFKNLMETGTPLEMEVFQQENEFKFWFRLTAVKLGDEIVSTAENITNRKKAEEELRKNISLLTQTEQLAQTGSWDYDIATRTFTWSEGMYRLFVLPQGEKVQPEIYLKFVTDHDRLIARRVVDNIEKENCEFEEVMHIERDGSIRLLKIKATIIKDDKGKPQKVVGIDLDITGAEEAEQKIEESQNLLRQTAQASPDSINVYDLVNKRPLYLNRRLADWIGCDMEDLHSMGFEGRLQLIHPDDRATVLEHNERMQQAEDGQVKTVEYRLQSRRGNIIQVRNRSKVFKRSADGSVSHILSVLQDVTDEAELKNQLIDRTRYVETILDNSIDRIMVFDRSYTIIGWNRRSEEHTGITKEQAIGANFFELVPQALQDEELKDVMQKALEGINQYIPVKKGIHTPYFYERFYIPLKDASGKTYAVLNMMHDVSGLVKKSEELEDLNKALEQNNKILEARNEEITNFAFIASHDLREPLRKINTFGNWLLTEEEKALSQKGKDYLHRMSVSVSRMNAMIDDILILTRINAESKKEEDVDLNEVFFLVQKELKKEIAKASAVITVEPLSPVRGKRSHLLQLFKNLVTNAIKFRRPDTMPVIKITSREVAGKDLTIEHANRDINYLCVCIADNGIGIDLKYANKLFQVFQRLHGLKEYKGTGMGLAICKKVMEKHHGFITVDSMPGEGSVFCCYFPA